MRRHPGAGGDAKRQKHGRLALRNVTRTLRREARFGDANGAEKQEEVSDIGAEAREERKVESAEAAANDSGMAYNALLTLLGTKGPKKHPQKSAVVENEGDEGDDDMEINFEKSDDDENDQEGDEDDEDDADASSSVNWFLAHFNEPSESLMDKASKAVTEKWSTSKETIQDYTVATSRPALALPFDGEHEPLAARLQLKKRVRETFLERQPHLSPLNTSLLHSMVTYQSVLYPYKSYSLTLHRELYSMHAINHIFKTRDNVLRNNERLRNHPDDNKEYRDQGFTRPKVLILLPTRNAAFEVVETILKYAGSEQEENKKKFRAQFYTSETPPDNKPADFKDAFKGNNNDFFCLGIKFTRKSAKLYSSFYSSDIIVASPLGLSMILENPDKKKRQYDFLSSIEVCIVDRANQIEAQNWSHVSLVMKYLNKVPKEFHDADFSRIRMWYINDQAPMLRQTLVFCEYTTPPITSLVASKSTNIGGRVRYKPLFTSKDSTMNSIGLRIKQIFQRFDSPSPLQDSDNRFKFFINSMLPSLMSSTSYQDGLLVYIPSYFDYVRVKNYMRNSTKYTFEGVDEYTSQSKLTRYRQQFAGGKIKILLYTERLHYFRRYEINGVKTLLMYEVPSNPVFYKELVRFIGKSVFKEAADVDLSFVKVMYSQWDAVALERIVGGERAPVLCKGASEMYEFR